jgi:hypothetical protein
MSASEPDAAGSQYAALSKMGRSTHRVAAWPRVLFASTLARNVAGPLRHRLAGDRTNGPHFVISTARTAAATCQEEGSITHSVRKAPFPDLRTPEEFDFTYQTRVHLQMLGSLIGRDLASEGRCAIFG